MKIIALIFSCIVLGYSGFSQERIEPTVDVKAHTIGLASDIDYVTKTQLLYPVTLLKKNINQDVKVDFTVLSNGTITDIEFIQLNLKTPKDKYKEEFKTEVKRLLRYFIFEPAKIGNISVASKSSLTFKFNTGLYRKYTKARGFAIPKELPLFDTSFVIYERADVSPEYIKGEDAFKEYIISNLEYPDLAIRQGLQGTVVLSFIVEPNGYLSNLVIEKEFNHLCTNEAIRIMRDTKWKAAKKNGKYVRYKSKYPIVFNLNNINKDNSNGEQR